MPENTSLKQSKLLTPSGGFCPLVFFLNNILNRWIKAWEMVTFCSEDRPVTHHHRTFHSLNHPCKRPVTRALFLFFCSLYSSFTDINKGITKQRKVTHMRQEKCRRGIRQANIKAERVVKWQQLGSERVCLKAKRTGRQIKLFISIILSGTFWNTENIHFL